MRVQNNFGARDSVQGGMNALRREFNNALAFQGLTRLIENHHVAGFGFRPVQTKWQHKVLVRTARYAGSEVIVDAFFKTIQNSHAQCSGQVDFDLLNSIDRAGCVKCVDSHGELQSKV